MEKKSLFYGKETFSFRRGEVCQDFRELIDSVFVYVRFSGFVLKSRFIRRLFVYSDLRCIDFLRLPYVYVTVYVDRNSGRLV